SHNHGPRPPPIPGEPPNNPVASSQDPSLALRPSLVAPSSQPSSAAHASVENLAAEVSGDTNSRGGPNRFRRGMRGERRGGGVRGRHTHASHPSNANARHYTGNVTGGTSVTRLPTGRQFGVQLTTPVEPTDPSSNSTHTMSADAPEFRPGQLHRPRPKGSQNVRKAPAAQHTHSQRHRRDSGLKSTAPDIATRTHEDIANSLYECPICTSDVGRNSKVWSCKTCWTAFHLACIKKWAANDGSTLSQQRDQDREPPPPRQWRCPGCNLPKDDDIAEEVSTPLRDVMPCRPMSTLHTHGAYRKLLLWQEYDIEASHVVIVERFANQFHAMSTVMRSPARRPLKATMGHGLSKSGLDLSDVEKSVSDKSSNRNVDATARQLSIVGATNAVNVVAPASEKRPRGRPSNANYDPLVHLEPLTTRLKPNISAPDLVLDHLSVATIHALSCVTKVHVEGVERLSSRSSAATVNKMLITCECQHLKQEMKCNAFKSSEGNSKKSLGCDDECARLERNRKLALALNIDPEASKDDHIPYSIDTLKMFRENVKWSQEQEREFRVFATDDAEKRLRFKAMPSHQRTFLRSLAQDFGFDSESMDPEPHRHVAVFKTPRFVSPPTKTLKECVRIQSDAEAAAASVLEEQRRSRSNNEAYNGFLLGHPRFGLTFDVLRSELTPQFNATPGLAFDISFLPTEEIVIKAKAASPSTNIQPSAIEAAVKAMKGPVAAIVSTKRLAETCQLCSLDASLNILRRALEDEGASDGWNRVASKAVGPRYALPQRGVGEKSVYTVLGSKIKDAKKKKEELEKAMAEEVPVDDWAEE
ncbi:MAG: hypothetical protein LQ341_005962, partial [Variospora aurantia]